MLRDFLVDSGLCGAESTERDGKPRRRGATGVKTEGVLVSCQTGSEDSISHPATPAVPTTATEASEEDDLIWWAWYGKLTGFAEW